MDDESLIVQAKKGDKEALVKLVMARKNEYYRLAYVFMGNQEDAMDVLQDMIITLFEQIHKLKKCESFHTWAKTILANSCKRRLKRYKKMIFLEEIDRFQVQVGKENLHPSIVPDTSLDLRRGLEKISEKQKEAIILKYFLDLDYETIGKLTQTPVGTVKSRIFNGLKNLKLILGGDY